MGNITESAHDGTVHAGVCLVFKLEHKSLHLSCSSFTHWMDITGFIFLGCW